MEQAEIEKLIGELDIGLDRLRSLYDQYFMGIERIEPSVVRKDIDRRIHVLRREQIRNTALRFRFQMLLQRYNTFQAHWQRICREIENGTYKRHMLRAQQRFADVAPVRQVAQAARMAELGAPVLGDLAAELAELDKEFAPAELDDVDILVDEEAASPARKPGPPAPPPLPRPSQPNPVWKKAEAVAPRPAGAPPPVPRPAGIPAAPATPVRLPAAAPAAAPARPAPVAASPKATDLPEERVRQLYAQYVDTKRRQNESTASITYEAVARTLRDSSAKLREKHGKPVDFEVRVKDGRTILKPIVK